MANLLNKLHLIKYFFNNYKVLNFIVILSVIQSFYPISSGSAILGYFSFIYLLFYWKELRINKLMLTIIILLSWIMISCFSTYDNFNNNTSSFLVKELRYFLFFLAGTIIVSKISFEKMLKNYICIGSVFTFLGYIGVFWGNELEWFFRIFRNRTEHTFIYLYDDVPRLTSISRNIDPNFVGFMIAVLLITVMAYFLHNFNDKKKSSAIYVLQLIFFTIALLLTASRGSILIALFALFFLLIYYAHVNKSWLIIKIMLMIFLLIILSIIVLGIAYPENILIKKILLLFNQNTYSSGTSEGMRIEMWGLAIHILRDYPIFGVGPTGFEECSKLPQYYIESLYKHNYRDPHNFILSVGMFAGVPGVIGIIFILYKGMKQQMSELKNYLTLKSMIAFGWCLCFIATSIFEYSLTDECRLMFLHILFILLSIKNKTIDKNF